MGATRRDTPPTRRNRVEAGLLARGSPPSVRPSRCSRTSDPARRMAHRLQLRGQLRPERMARRTGFPLSPPHIDGENLDRYRSSGIVHPAVNRGRAPRWMMGRIGSRLLLSCDRPCLFRNDAGSDAHRAIVPLRSRSPDQERFVEPLLGFRQPRRDAADEAGIEGCADRPLVRSPPVVEPRSDHCEDDDAGYRFSAPTRSSRQQQRPVASRPCPPSWR